MKKTIIRLICFLIPFTELRRKTRNRIMNKLFENSESDDARNYLINHLKNSCCISYSPGIKDLLERGTQFYHPLGVVIGKDVRMGKNCIILQNVTLGFKGGGYPTLEDNVKVLAGAIVLGNITIGKNSVVGAGSVVLKDVPSNQVWAGNPARYIKDIPTDNDKYF